MSTITLKIITCLKPEFLVTIQLSLGDGTTHIKTLKGEQDRDLLGKFDNIPKHAILLYKLDTSHHDVEDVKLLAAWPKERRFAEWTLDSDEDANFYVTKDGIYFIEQQDDDEESSQDKIKVGEWRKMKKLNELRGASGKLVSIECVPVELKEEDKK